MAANLTEVVVVSAGALHVRIKDGASPADIAKVLDKLQGKQITSVAHINPRRDLKELAKAYAELKSVELGGPIRFDVSEKGEIEIWASGLPSHPQYLHSRTWSMSDKKTPLEAQQYLSERGCMGQSWAYDPELAAA